MSDPYDNGSTTLGPPREGRGTLGSDSRPAKHTERAQVRVADRDPFDTTPQTDEDLARDVARFALVKIGQKAVGRGQCWDLPEHILAESGGKTSSQLTGKKDFAAAKYKWGEKVLEAKDGKLVDGKFENIKPGYIIQYKNHVQVVKKVVDKKKVIDDEIRGPDHSNVIVGVNSDGSVFVSEQHTGGDHTIKKGRVWLLKLSDDGDVQSVKGTVWVYKPQLNKKK